MLKLNIHARVAAALGASLLMAGSASAASTSNSDFLNFFESIFDNDSNGGASAAANLDADLQEVIQSVSVLGDPEEGEAYEGEVPADGGRRVVGGDPEIIVPVVMPPVDYPVPPRRGGGDGGAHPVPEPSAGILFGLGALLVQRRLRR